jgi:glycosyltransferase involved in cell wall biosynthesis
MKTVTVIIPTYNRENIIGRTLTSILDQDYRKVDILVVDDGSTDATEQVIKSIAERNEDVDKRIRYVRQDNQGACVARNRGMQLAIGDYIMFLDSDDLIKRSKLSTQVKQIETENSQCSICDFERIDEAGRIIGYANNNRHPHDFIRNLVSPHISTVLMRRDSIPPNLQWNVKLKRNQDMDFIYKYFSSIGDWSYVNQALFQYCLHGGEQISDSYSKGFQYRVLRESFKTYLENDKKFVSTDPMQLYRSYRWALGKHQLKNALIAFTPNHVKKFIKRYLHLFK